jgi:hypothetical protein
MMIFARAVNAYWLYGDHEHQTISDEVSAGAPMHTSFYEGSKFGRTKTNAHFWCYKMMQHKRFNP